MAQMDQFVRLCLVVLSVLLILAGQHLHGVQMALMGQLHLVVLLVLLVQWPLNYSIVVKSHSHIMHKRLIINKSCTCKGTLPNKLHGYAGEFCRTTASSKYRGMRGQFLSINLIHRKTWYKKVIDVKIPHKRKNMHRVTK